MDKLIEKDEAVVTKNKVQKTRPKKSKFENKKRNSINISLQKRNLDLLNAILNEWVEDGCNISNEICNAIIFKNKSDVNPHIRTILSTLSLIESSLKSKKGLKDMSDEEIDSKVLEIFNEVITIDIDGTRLTNLLKSISITDENKTLVEDKQEIKSKDLKNNKPPQQNETKKDSDNQDSFVENENQYSEIKDEVNVDDGPKSQSSSNVCEKKVDLDWSNSFPKEKIGEKKSSQDNVGKNNNNLIKGFIAPGGFM